MIVLENLSLDDDDPDGVASQRELEELADLLRAEGDAVEVRPWGRVEYAELRESVGDHAVDVLNVVLDGTAEAAATMLLDTIARWAQSRTRFRGYQPGDRTYVAIWSADGHRVLSRVEIPAPDEDARHRKL